MEDASASDFYAVLNVSKDVRVLATGLISSAFYLSFKALIADFVFCTTQTNTKMKKIKR